VSTRSILHCDHGGSLAALLRREDGAAPFVGSDCRKQRRRKIWDLSPNLHCSIVGTCLNPAELRQIFGKLREPDARTASDHSLHGRGVSAAGRHDLRGKLLHKTLDARHEATIRRFDRASTAAEVALLWREALAQGAISGAYWAALTHPATDHAPVQEVFGEIHMLSHRVGASNRLDIARLRKLEGEIGERDDKIARQEARLQAASHDRAALARRIGDLEAAIVRLEATAKANSAPAVDEGAAARAWRRIGEERAHSDAQAERLTAAEQRADRTEARVAALTARNRLLERELAVLEEAPAGEGADWPRAAAAVDLSGLRLLYVGGRPKLIDRLRAMTGRRDGVLLAHDGGVEDNAALLPGLVSQADRIFFPVDCISHHAAGRVEKLCRRLGKPFVPLRTASLAAFAAALATGGAVHDPVELAE